MTFGADIINLRRDVCRRCATPCAPIEEIPIADSCARCPIRRWGAWDCPSVAIEPDAQREVSVLRSEPKGGPGSELKGILAKFGIHEQGCACASHARKMDRLGPKWCRDNMDTIVGWLREEAENRGLRFWAPGAKALVWLAIRKARKQEKV